MNIAQIEENVLTLLSELDEGQVDQDSFIYELLLAYGHRKQSVTRLRSGERNLASKSNEPKHDEIIWKRNLYYRRIEGNSLHSEIDQMRKEKLVATNKIRFVIVTNFDNLLAFDTKTSDSLDISLNGITKQFDFFLPWAGIEKAMYQGESPADIKAAEKMAKLFDSIKRDNITNSDKDNTESLHSLNVFLTRLLFCFFAEDTEIFAEQQFSSAIQSHTRENGKDLSDYLERLFSVLNTANADRIALPDYLSEFPYVNGGLFSDELPSPVFSAMSRRTLIECGSELNWSDINPDIFGSMIQAVVHPDQRGGMGVHYTSVSNILKLIEPLFLNDLYEELEKNESNAKKLHGLQQRLGEIRVFDPACGSGNFLIIAYKELRKIEMEILSRLQEIELEKTGQISQPFSVIKLSQFYGIELDHFAHEVAILSLWLAEHQMDIEFKAEFGKVSPSLPLQVSGVIVCGNSNRIDWNEVCPIHGHEVYVLGNPPYLGQRNQEKYHREDMIEVFTGLKNFKNLDYIACWFLKAARYINDGGKFAFVTTNSLCQGTQVEMLWPHILDGSREIFFAYKNIKWTNSARNNAGVTVSIIGVGKGAITNKYIYENGLKTNAKNINAYLVDGENIIVSKRRTPISLLPKMEGGNQPREGGYLILSDEEKNDLVASTPNVAKYIRPLCGSSEFIRGTPRWCIWIREADVEDAVKIPELNQRIQKIKTLRENGNTVEKGFVNYPYRFVQIKEAKNSQIIVPVVSSERRRYLPVGFLDANTVILNSSNVVYDSEPYVFGILSSLMHMTWVQAVVGRMRTDIRYTTGVCYNSFPIPNVNDAKKKEIETAAMDVLMTRENHPDKPISVLYDPIDMPKDLVEAHANLDNSIDTVYRRKLFTSDSERLTVLFDLYKEMTRNASA